MRILDRKRSPGERLRVLASAWRQVHRLSAEDRYKLALRVGIEGLDEAIGELASREGVETPERLRDALAKLAATEPARARSLLRAWRDPAQRQALLKHGLEAAIDALAGEAAVPGAPPAPTPSRRTDTTQPIPVPTLQAALAGALPIAPAPAAGRAPTAAGPAPEPPAAAAPPPAASPPATPPPAAPPPVFAGAPARLAPAPALRSLRRVPLRAAAPAEPGLAPGRPSARDAGPAGARSLLERFRRLRSQLAALVGLDEAALREQLAAFPDGWPRRRALVQLIEAGLGAPCALALVATLGSRRDRLWCLRRLARQAGLETAAAAAALGEPLPPGLTRRLVGRPTPDPD